MPLYRSGNVANITSGTITGITDLAVADGGTGSSTGAAALTALGAGTGDSPQFTAVNIGHATDSTVTRLAAGILAIEGKPWPLSLGSWGIPMVMPSSGSIGNNGALSGISALPATHAHAYLYFPADAIVAGSAAGLYYCVMSSTTAGTIYNNTYTSGIPSIPTPTPFVTTGPGAYTQTTGAITLISINMPANSMGPNGQVEYEILMSMKNDATAKTFQPRFGGTEYQQLNLASLTNGQAHVRISNRGVTNSQVGLQIGGGYGYHGGSSTLVTSAIDTTAIVALSIDATLAGADDTMTLESGKMFVTYGA